MMLAHHSSSHQCFSYRASSPCHHAVRPRRHTRMQAAPQHINNLSEVASRFKAVLLDQFGVLHDGRDPYSSATVAAVKHLSDAGVKVYIISNSSRRSSGTFKKLERLGFDPAWFVGAVTSGDMAHLYLQDRPTDWWRGLGNKCIHFTWSSRGTISLDDLGLQVTVNPEEADFILAHGTEALGQPGSSAAAETTLEGMRDIMPACAARGLPMIVANPDLVTVDGPGSLAIMPGTLAKWYAEMGGNVHLMGKPAPVIYQAAMQALGLQPHEVLAIGDSLEHDIAGAASAGIDSVFVAGGIHAEELGVPKGTHEAGYCMQSLEGLCGKFGVNPTYSMAFFIW